MEGDRQRRGRRIFRLILIPLLFLVIMQAVLSFGAVIVGGAFSSIRSYAADRLSQVTETRQIILESRMVQQWSEMGEEYDMALGTLEDVLSAHNLDIDAFLADRELREDYLSSMLPTLCYMMRKNSTTGAFIVLLPEGTAENGGTLSALYLRDGDPDANPADYSDLFLTVGPSNASQTYQIPLGINWRSRLTLEPDGVRESDRFVYAPYTAALEHPEQGAKNQCFWSCPFSLEDDPSDSYRMITCSMPLIGADSRVLGVIGIEISLPYLEENLPPLEVDSGHRGGYLLLEAAGGDSYRLVHASGATAGQFTMELDEITLEPANADGLMCLHGDGQDGFLSLKPLRLYNTNTPFYENGWYLAGLESRSALFGISDNLTGIFVAATLFSLAIAILLALVLVRHVTGPIRRLSACIQNSPGNELKEFPYSNITEVDELYDTIRRLTERQKQIEYDLLDEKERYRLALQSSSDILVTHDIDNDRTVFNNLDGGGHEETVYGLMSSINQHDYIHPDDKRILLARLTDGQNDISVSFRVNWPARNEGYRWYEFNGRILPAGDGRPRMLIGAMHNIHDQKLQEMAEYESLHRDSLTGLYHRASGEDVVRSSIQSGHGGCLILMDVRGIGELNKQLGIVAGNTVIEEIGHLLLEWRQSGEAPAQSMLLRIGGDEFMLWLEDFERSQADDTVMKLCRRAGGLYTEGTFTARLACGCARRLANESYSSLFGRACGALAAAKSGDSELCVWAEDRNIRSAGEGGVITPVEYYASAIRSIVPLTFAFFDRGGDIGSVLSVLFPKLGREVGAEDIVLSLVSRDFFTVSAVHQWHRDESTEPDHEVVHFTSEEFRAIEAELWPDVSVVHKLSELTPAQRRFLRVPAERSGLVFPLFDGANCMGAVFFAAAPGEASNIEGHGRELHEAVKVIEANLNRQRYDSASRAKSDFLSRMSHEIRTPMNAIIGMTYIAKTHTDDVEAVKADLEKIDQSSHYLLGLINDILDMSRIESGKLSINSAPMELDDAVDGVSELISTQAEAKHIDYRVDADIPRPSVEGDVLRINQVLINLLGNAVKFTPDGGSVTLTVRQSSNGDVFFSVKDTGIGVSRENHDRIFLSFEQAENSTVRKYGGTGLGLAISSRLVRMMGGVINLDSELGKGSDFSFTINLPFAENAEVETPAGEAPSPSPVNAEGLRILLVEDNELNIEIAQSILEMHGAEVTLAFNGREAVDKFTASRPGDFDLILMDIQMPVMDGLEATKEIRRSSHPMAADIPIIAMTANAFDEDMKRSVESGMNGHLSKPLDFDKVFEVIMQVLNRQ